MPAPRFVLDEFWPSDLFLGGIPGAWYDPTDLSTMFQDSTGTTPVTAVEQPVGLIFDKSQGTPAARRNLLTYTEQFNNVAGWSAARGTATGDTTVAPDGTTTADTWTEDNQVGDHDLRQVVAITNGVTYTISCYFKANTRTFAQISTFGTGIGLRGAVVNLSNGSVANMGGGYGAFASVSATALANGWYRLQVTQTAGATGNTTLSVGATTTSTGTPSYAGDGASNLYVWGAQLEVGSTATTYQRITTGIGGEWTPGNHASQSTAASRPTYRARYNLLTYSEEFQNAAWQKNDGATVTTDAVLAPDGTLTADALNIGTLNISRVQQPLAALTTATMTYSVWMRVASGTEQIRFGDSTALTTVTVTSTWQRFVVVVNITGTAPNLTIRNDTAGGAKTIYAWGAQLLTAADVTATGNAYQRIAAATVYDTAPIFRPYLAFDGIDDSLATAAINLTSTSKATVFVGQTKNSDAAGSVILGHGVDFSAVGAWEYQGNTAANATTAFRGRSTAGSAAQAGYTRDVTSPATFVFVSIVDYTAAAGAEFAGRYNTVAQAQNVGVTEENTGTFGNNVLTIGARQGGASLRFNGRLYSVILRGAASSVTEIADTELWVNARTGAY